MISRRFFPILAALPFVVPVLQAATPSPFGLDLPDQPVPDRVSITRRIEAERKESWAELEGPGCIRHLWVTLTRPGRMEMPNRKIIIRIFFDDSETPHVEAPVGDFFGMMHGKDFYEINTELLSVKPWSGYNCYFEMPFAKKARIEFETGPEGNQIYLQADWERYPDQELKEERRFCAQWRREMPTQRYGEDFFMLDADGPGQLIGFVYGVRLIDNVDRWSHGGAENLYIDGLGDHPAFIRGIGGEDTFGTAYGGALHPPSSHLYASMPYYLHEDTGEARPAQRLTGYRFFIRDPIHFRESLHMRFGTMENDISAMVYWYQTGSPRRNTKMPKKWDQLLPGKELKRGKMDRPLPDRGAWQVRGVFDNADNQAIQAAAAGRELNAIESEKTEWIERPTMHGFVDFNHVYRPGKRGVGNHHRGKAAQARCVLHSERAQTVKLRFAWDDHLVARVNDDAPQDLGYHSAFRAREIEVKLNPGANPVLLTLSNEQGTNHGGWAFALKATGEDGKVLAPVAR